MRGRTLATVFLVIALVLACASAGYYVGRNVLGEQYIKRGASKLRSRPAPSIPANAAAVAEPTVIEEPQSVIEPAEEEPEPARRERPTRAAAREEQTPPAREAAQTVTLQLGYFLKSENAKALVQDLRNRGYSPRVSAARQGESTVHRVQMGPLSPEQGRALAAELRRQGYEVGVLGGE